MGVEVKNGNEIAKTVMKEDSITQTELAKRMGYEWQGNISSMINSPRMSLDKFVKMLNAMGRHVYVGDENGNIEYEVKQ